MSDLAKWKVHGPVATLRRENTEWDADRQDWKPARFFTLTSFRRDGAIDSSETHNPAAPSHTRAGSTTAQAASQNPTPG